jgi:adenylate cyclase class 2
MIEAELKARLTDPAETARRLERLAPGRDEIYHDTYYDFPDQRLDHADHEVRVRTITGDHARSLLTFKTARVDEVSESKPEYETEITDPGAVRALLRGLGLVPLIAFEKHCRNHNITARGRDMLATMAHVPEIAGTFLELEALAEEHELDAALADIRSTLDDLGISATDLTTDTYTAAVRATMS